MPDSVPFVRDPSPQFFRTTDSDEWVRQSFHVQQRYSRVLVVNASGVGPESLVVESLDLNTRPASSGAGSAGEKTQYPVARVFRTIQDAVDESRGGDLIAVLPGTYAGFEIHHRPDTGDGRYIHIKAIGAPGEVTINDASERGQRRHHIWIPGGSYTIIQGFNIAGSTGPGLPQSGTTSGMLIGGAFGETGRMTHHVAVIQCFSHNHRVWGMHSTDSHTVLMQDNCFALSNREHCAYISNGSDNYCVRRNVFFASSGCGLHCNLDSYCSLHTILMRHSAMKDYPPYEATSQYVARLLKAATEIYGQNNFPDGRGPNFIIEENVFTGNGVNGGGAINLAGVHDSVVQNNLIYNNTAHGIAQYNDSAPHVDYAAIMQGGRSVQDAAAAPDKILFGTYRNLVRHNTVLMNAPGRYAIGMVNGAWGNRLRNNIFINNGGPSIEVTAQSLRDLDSGYNIANTLAYSAFAKAAPNSPWPDPPELSEDYAVLAKHRDERNHSTLGISLEAIAGHFVRPSNEPWILIEGNWWRLNPNRPDFHPRPASALLCGRGDPVELAPLDIEHERRDAADIGAYRAARG